MRKGRRGGRIALTVFLGLFLAISSTFPASAANPANPAPQSGSIGLEGTISSAPPKSGATITVPGSGTAVTSTPVTVSGLCPNGLLVKIFSNGIFVGSTVCLGGTYSLKVDLFAGRNDLVARVYDALDQPGPDSNTVTVTFNDAQFLRFGTQLSLSSPYGERGAPPGTELDWPVLLSGGVGPYAISTDWGDGTSAELVSASFAGTITLKHTYKTAGLYTVVVKATDKNGAAAFLQLVGQATGAVQNNKSGGNTNVQTRVVWWPTAVMLPLMLVSFWLGGRYQLHRRYTP